MRGRGTEGVGFSDYGGMTVRGWANSREKRLMHQGSTSEGMFKGFVKMTFRVRLCFAASVRWKLPGPWACESHYEKGLMSDFGP